MEHVRINERRVGPAEPTFIIAEVGSNHDQKFDQAKQLIEVVEEAGADAVKFQLYEADDLYPDDTDAHEMLASTELPHEWLPDLAEHARERGLSFFASPFSRSAVDRLVELQVPAIKWASSETVNLGLLGYAARQSTPLILSTGMSNMADVYEAVELVRSLGNEDLVLLQCTSVYPAEPDSVNLRVMDAFRAMFGCPVGFSDHTLGTEIPVAAVARGASVIEKHVTIDKDLDGPDHHYALEPDELARMVQGIRSTEEALGSSVKKMIDEEKKHARRESLHASKDIQEGEVITSDHFTAKRPAGGIPPRFCEVLSQSRARVNVDQDEHLTWNKIVLE